MRAAPSAFRGFLHIRVQTDHVVSSGTGITQDNLSPLLTHLTIVLVVGLIAIGFIIYYTEKRGLGHSRQIEKIFP